MGMNARIKITFAVLASVVLVVILAAVIFILTFDINSYKPRIAAAVSEATGMDVSIDGRMNLAIFPETGISIENISIRNKGIDVARAKNVKVGMSLRHLLRRQIIIESLDLTDPSFFVIEDREGRFNFETPHRRPREKAFTTGNISIKGGDFMFVKQKTGAKVEFVNCNLAIRDLYVGTGDMPGALSFAGDLSCGEVKGKDLRIEDVKAPIKMLQGILEADPVALKLFGGEGRGRLIIALADKNPRYTVDLEVKKLRFEEVLATFKENKNIRGELDLTAHLAMAGKGTDEMTRTAEGTVSIRGQDLSLSGFNIDRVLAKYEESTNVNLVDIGASLIAGPLGMVLTKGYEIGSLYSETLGGDSVIKKLNSDWKVKSGIARAEDVALSTLHNRIALKGKIDFVGERFDNVTIAVLDERGCAKVSQEMYGPFRHPHIEKANILISIAVPLLNFLGKLDEFFDGGRCRVFYSGTLRQPK
ncbi:MAG TPA: AsmA family protein [Syntrophales bacterium]|nr:AsmA family protein [Syntrophales bacterium]